MPEHGGPEHGGPEHGRPEHPAIEPCGKRIRVLLGGRVIADSTAAMLVWEAPYYPTYYLPRADVEAAALVPTGRSRDGAEVLDVRSGDRRASEGALAYRDETMDAIRFDWHAMDAWFEEDEEVYVHPRSPYVRVDILPSSREITVSLDGVTLAHSTSARLLFETALPTRYYLPKTDVRLERLEPSTSTSRCPYKGTAEYYSVLLGDDRHADLAWWYRSPAAESQRIAGLVCFYNERVDITVDGVRQPRPHTKFGASPIR
ncbi:MAG: DUF427 domain-containing protein [Sciscionella sp.]